MNIADYIFDHSARNLKPESVADILGRLIWILDDNGQEIIETLKRWVKSDNKERIRIALEFDEVYLFEGREEMIGQYNKVCLAYPELKSKCEERIKDFDIQFGNS